MALDRESIFVALFARLQGAYAWKLSSRKYRGIDDALQGEQPALYLVKGAEEAIRERGLPTIWKLTATAFVLVRNDADTYAAPSTMLNTVIQAVEASLERSPLDGPVGASPFGNNLDSAFQTTLGGLCYSCQIAGAIDVHEGASTDQAVAILPIELVALA